MRRALALAAAVALLGTAWWFLAPTQLGGRTSYAVIFGISMEPHFHRGDLVVLRTRPSYRVGEIVAYRSRQLHKDVLHRIIAIHGGRYTFKGDNNDFVDPEHPTASQLVGQEWLHVGRIGDWLAALHTPLYAAIAAGLIVLLLAGTGGGTVAHRRRRRRLPPVEKQPRRERASADAAPSLGFAVAAAGAGALLAAAVLGAFAFTRPTERSLVWANLYVQHGRFSYAAPVPRGATYQAPRLRSGDPVYLRLVHRLPVAFSWRLQAARPVGIHGTLGLTAVLGDGSGWTHRIVLAPSRPFSGTRAVAHGVLDLQALETTVAAFERQTGEHNTLYDVRLDARVTVQGTVAERPLVASFAESAPFNLDQLRLSVAAPDTPGGTAAADPLVEARSGAGVRVETTYLHAFGRAVTVGRARELTKLLGGVGGALALVGGVLTLFGRRGQEAAAIRRRYEDWIVDVAPHQRPHMTERWVGSMDALARLAQRYDRLILHERRDGGDAFLIEDDGVVYTYFVRDWNRSLAVPL